MSKMKVNRIENTATTAGGIDIDSSGDVGVGTSSPQSLLSVKVSASRQLDVIKDSGDDHLVLKSTAPDASYNLRSIELAGTDVSFSTGASSGTAYTERMKIDSNGTTTFAGAIDLTDSTVDLYSQTTTATSKTFQLYSDIGGTKTEKASISANGNATFVGDVICADETIKLVTSSAHGLVQVKNSSGSTRIQLSASDSRIKASSLAGSGSRAVYSSSLGILVNLSSDGTLKTNVAPLTTQTEIVKQLNPVAYNWIDTEIFGGHREIGFIAQEVEPLIPEVVGINHDETLTVDYSKITAVLTKALQEAIAKIETLEIKVAALEAAE